MYSIEIMALYELKSGKNFAEAMIYLAPSNFPRPVVFEISNDVFGEFVSGSSWDIDHCSAESKINARVWRPCPFKEPDIEIPRD